MLDEDGVHRYHGVEQAGRHSTLPFLGAILQSRKKEEEEDDDEEKEEEEEEEETKMYIKQE